MNDHLRRCRQELRVAGAVAEASEDDDEEVAEGIGREGRAEEEKTHCPDLDVTHSLEDTDLCELLVLEIPTVDVDAVLNQLTLLLAEESSLGREVGNDSIADEGSKDCHQSHHCKRSSAELA